MIVRELIEALQQFDPETEVIGIEDSYDGPTWIRNVQPEAVKVVRSRWDRRMYGDNFPVVHEYGPATREVDYDPPFNAVIIR